MKNNSKYNCAEIPLHKKYILKCVIFLTTKLLFCTEIIDETLILRIIHSKILKVAFDF